jgi:glycosyltransferase involved in cell wall biosynthesis
MSGGSRPRLAELPAPPAGRNGWPWTEETAPLPEQMPDGSAWPRISIVTPSFNQGLYLEETLRSVLLQGYPNLEYIVVDGGSTDDSPQILEKYRAFLDFSIRESTEGHADAVNRGMKRATGSIVAFINSDDFYLPGAFAAIAQAFQAARTADFVYGGCLIVDQMGREIIRHLGNISSLDEALDFLNVWRADREIVQPEAFWRRTAFEKIGSFNTKVGCSFWYEFVCRLLMSGASFHRVAQPLACFRIQPEQRSQKQCDRLYEDYLDLAQRWLWDNSLAISPTVRRRLQNEWVFERKYKPLIAVSTAPGGSRVGQWMGTAKICLQHPSFFSELSFVKRLKKGTAVDSKKEKARTP